MKKLFLLAFLIALIACKSTQKDNKNLLFEQLDAAKTGVTFENKLTESEQWNIIQYLYFYNGGGVAVGDINGDKLPDIYFTSNQGANKLYLNKGNFQFEDITDKAGVADKEGWKTGVTMVDINADGRLDIYVSHVSEYKGLTGRNRLFINNGDGTFTDKAAYFGLDAAGLCTQAAFFDYDGDGDLDCYLLRHSVHSARSYRPVSARNEKDSLSSDVLFKNYGGRFEDETAKSGIKDGSLGYGLGLSIGDFNSDGLPDIYVGNDFHDNDYLYYNNGNGTFTEGVTKSVGHTSNFSMGNDASDFNNDGKLDVVSLDMKPEEETILKASAGADPYNIFDYKNKEFGYHFQYPRNMLQLNRGASQSSKGGESPPLGVFSEIGQLSGISATDWSWSSLFADFDNDGWKDLYITNGIMRRPNDLDYIKYISNQEVQNKASDLALSKQMPDGKASNYCFRNKGDLTFENVGETWGLNQYGLSNGAAYADFDNDGDLDLVVNNVNAPAFLLKNKSEKFNNNRFLKIKLEGKGGNTEGVGAKVIAYTQSGLQLQEQSPMRGFQSSVEPILHFGFINKAGNEHTFIDSLRVIWRDGSTQLLQNININQTLTLKQKEATAKWDYKRDIAQRNITLSVAFQDITDEMKLKYIPFNNTVSDFENEKLLPHAFSSEGSKIEVGDWNNDKLPDFEVNNQVFYQDKTGFSLGKPRDLSEKKVNTADRKTTKKDTTIGFILPANIACRRTCDFDGDGDLDEFIAARRDSKNYGISPKSLLIRRDSNGFKDVTSQYFEEDNETSESNREGNLGMVTDAAWTDLDGDNRPDLVVVGEWMPITIFYNKGDHFKKMEIENTSGWWNCITIADMDKDGDNDLIIGNMGLNSNWKASPTQPMSLFVKDFDNNGDKESIISYWRQGIEWPYNSKDELTSQMPFLKKRFQEYAPFSRTPFSKVFTLEMLKGAVHKQIELFSSVYLENKDGEGFELKVLPTEAQFSTVQSILADDFDDDGNMDIALGGNFYEMQPSIGRFDASYGSILWGNGKGKFTPLAPTQTGFILRGAVRDIKKVGNYIVVSSNNAPLKIFDLKRKKKVVK
jgi:enediyne biosynthesis protein E4